MALKMWTLVLAPFVHALIMIAVQMVKEGGKPPIKLRSKEAREPESEGRLYEKSRTEMGDFAAIAKKGKTKQKSRINVISL